MVNSKNNDFIEVRQVLESKWLKFHIRSRIHALKLSSSVSEEDVIQYVATCLFETIESGKQINHPVAWSKLVSERHIQKLYKKHKVCEATESDKIEYLANLRCNENNFYNNEEMTKSIQQLKPANREIIKLRFFDNLSWKQIAKILSDREGKKVCETAARKRGERAVEKLKKIYPYKLVE